MPGWSASGSSLMQSWTGQNAAADEERLVNTACHQHGNNKQQTPTRVFLRSHGFLFGFLFQNRSFSELLSWFLSSSHTAASLRGRLPAAGENRRGRDSTKALRAKRGTECSLVIQDRSVEPGETRFY